VKYRSKESDQLKIPFAVKVVLWACVINATTAQLAIADAAMLRPADYTKGQAQLSGGNGKFGVVYSFQDLWNEEVLSATYTMEPFCGSSNLFCGDKDKMIVFTVALKNAKASARWFNGQGRYTVVDQFGKQYSDHSEYLASAGEGTFEPTLNPGQGIGQPAKKDPVRMAFLIDGNSRITKFVINEGRLGHNEQVLRFFLKGATADEDGAAGDPLNVVAPLPKGAQDPTDPSGATALAVGSAGKPGDGTVVPTRYYDISVDSFGDAPAGTTVNSQPPGANKKYVQAFITVRNNTPNPIDTSWLRGAGKHFLIDTDGDSYEYDDALKASSDDEAGGQIQPNDSVKWRFVFEIPVNTKLQTLEIGANSSRLWKFDVSGS